MFVLVFYFFLYFFDFFKLDNRNKGLMFGGGMWIIIGVGVFGLVIVCIIIVCW